MRIQVNPAVIRPYQPPTPDPLPETVAPTRYVRVAIGAPVGSVMGQDGAIPSGATDVLCGVLDLFGVENGSRAVALQNLPSAIVGLADPRSDAVKSVTRAASAVLGVAPETTQVQAISIAVSGADLLHDALKGRVEPVDAMLVGGQAFANLTALLAERFGYRHVATGSRVVALILQTAAGARVLLASDHKAA